MSKVGLAPWHPARLRSSPRYSVSQYWVVDAIHGAHQGTFVGFVHPFRMEIFPLYSSRTVIAFSSIPGPLCRNRTRGRASFAGQSWGQYLTPHAPLALYSHSNLLHCSS